MEIHMVWYSFIDTYLLATVLSGALNCEDSKEVTGSMWMW